jgi:hypothetical protein
MAGSSGRGRASDLRGASRLAVDGVTGVTDLVEAMHAAVSQLPPPAGPAGPGRTTGLTRVVYRSVRGIARLVGAGVDASLAALAPVLGEAALSPRREALVAAINGVLGDHLHAQGNPLATRMQFRCQGEALELTRRHLAARLPAAGGKLLVLVHGLCMNDLQWRQGGHEHGEALAAALGYTPVYLHYNSGRHVSTNGFEFAALLQQLLKAWPAPVTELVLLCHSMGGLVARSALDVAVRGKRAWTRLPVRVVFLGTPHHGAPLERAGSWADLLIGISPYSAPFVRLGGARSAGIRDLRHGNLRESDWREGMADLRVDGRTPMPLPKGVRAYAVAATTRPSAAGDGLVPVASAFGEHADPAFDLGIPASRRWLAQGTNHIELLGSAAVYRRIAAWLERG